MTNTSGFLEIDNKPIVGCPYCEGTAGRLGCEIHRYKHSKPLPSKEKEAPNDKR